MIVIRKFNHDQSFCSIVLYVITIFSKINFDVLINSLRWFVWLRIKDCKEMAFNIQTFAERLSNDDYKLKIAIRSNELK